MADHASAKKPEAIRRTDVAARSSVSGPAAAPLRSPATQALADTARHLNSHHPPALQRAATALAKRRVAQCGVGSPEQRPMLPSPAPIQLYAMANGAKLSDGQGLCLVDTQQLYAGDDQFAQANQIPGHVGFAPGAQIPDGYVAAEQAAKLHRVVASLKPDYQLHNSYFRTDAVGNISEPRAEDIDDQTSNDRLAEAGTLNEGNYQAYLQSQQGRDGPLLPSNCNEAALFVSGSSNRQTSDENVPEPGSVYEHTVGGEGSEWAFHYATIIMSDGNDHVTMENAGAKVSQNFSKKMMDKTWFYKMYGNADGQTFAEEYAADLPGGQVNIQRPAPVVAAIDHGADEGVDDEPADDHAGLLGQPPQQPEGWSVMGAIGACLRGLGSCLPGWGGGAD
ncbi:hypothetical protein BH10PSE14_BH10PSE14_00700 [soil metagenome]